MSDTTLYTSLMECLNFSTTFISSWDSLFYLVFFLCFNFIIIIQTFIDLFSGNWGKDGLQKDLKKLGADTAKLGKDFAWVQNIADFIDLKDL